MASDALELADEGALPLDVHLCDEEDEPGGKRDEERVAEEGRAERQEADQDADEERSGGAVALDPGVLEGGGAAQAELLPGPEGEAGHPGGDDGLDGGHPGPLLDEPFGGDAVGLHDPIVAAPPKRARARRQRAERRKDDFYRTPAWCVKSILPHLPRFGDVLDPCAGDGAMLMVLREVGILARGFELDEGRGRACRAHGFGCYIGDALAADSPWHAPGVVLTNPPFSLAQEMVERALAEVAPGGTVAMLLRLGFLASQGRAALHRRAPADVFVLPMRPSFTEDGQTDQSEYAWFVWGPGRGGRWQVLELVDAPAPRMRSAERVAR